MVGHWFVSPLGKVRDDGTDGSGEEKEEVFDEEDSSPDVLRHPRSKDMLAICTKSSIRDHKEGGEHLHHLSEGGVEYNKGEGGGEWSSPAQW
jgi:hypothetical protein